MPKTKRNKRFEVLENRPVHKDGFIGEWVDVGLYAMGSPNDPKPSIKIENGRVVEMDGVRIDVERHQVLVDGQEVRLALREFELLELLLRNAGRVMTRGQIIDRIWGSDYVGDTKTLDVHVKRLRNKIEREPSKPSRVITVRGLGYKFRG